MAGLGAQAINDGGLFDMTPIRDLMQREPVAVSAVVASVIGVLVALGVVAFTPEEVDQLAELVAALIVAVSGIAGSLVARRRVTPTDAPRLADGRSAHLVAAEPTVVSDSWAPVQRDAAKANGQRRYVRRSQATD